MRSTWQWLAPEAGQIVVCSKGCWVSCSLLTECLSLNWVNTLASLTPHHTVALDLGHPWLWKRLKSRMQRWPSPAMGPVWSGSSYCWCLLKGCLRSCPDLWWWLFHHRSHHSTCQESIWTPTSLVEQFHNRAGVAEAKGSDTQLGTKETCTWSCAWVEILVLTQAAH